MKIDKSRIKDRIPSVFYSALTIIWAVSVIIILAFLLFLHESIDYKCKVLFGVSNASLFLLSICCAIALCSLYLFKKGKVDFVFSKIRDWHVILASVIFLCIQIFVFYNIFFKTGWDVRQILEASEAIASDVEHTISQDWYYLRYPNNLLMTWIFSVMMKVCNLLGLTSEFNHIFAIIIVQCILFCISSILLFKVVKNIIGNPIIPLFAWILYWANVGFNPTLTTPYSDSLSLIFPIAILYTYQSIPNGKYLPLKWSIITVFSYLGYQIKPQVLIILIAISICELVKFFSTYNKKEKFTNGMGYCMGVVALCITTIISSFGLSRLPVRLDENKVFGFSHFLMMGLNEETGGAYSDKDVEFSAQFDTAEERREANIKEVKERLKKFKFSGLAKFMVKKCMTNFGNGTYAWSLEGDFYHNVPEEKNETISPFLRSYYYSYGKNYIVFLTLQQFLWITILIGNFGIIFTVSDKKMRSMTALPMLSLIGLAMFEMLFEARARYLFNYSTIFIITAAIGWYYMFKVAVALKEKVKIKINEEKEVEK